MWTLQYALLLTLNVQCRTTDRYQRRLHLTVSYKLILVKDKKATTAIKQEEESNTARDILFLLYFDDLFRASMNALLPRSSLLLRPMPCQRLLAGARQRQQQQVVAAATTRSKHSSTQIKRLFRKHPARQRVEERLGINRLGDPPPSITFEAVCQPEILSNGWSAPPSADLPLPAYPFSVTRTKNKPKDAVGFLPVYSKMRYVSIDGLDGNLARWALSSP